MNLQTLKQLAQNPHYKLSPKQKAMLEKANRKPMVEFGVPRIHDNKLKIHDTNQRKRRRK